MTGIRATGQSGILRVGYQWAADLGAWELAPNPSSAGFILKSRITRRHDYWFGCDSIDLVLTLGQTEWVWRGVSLMCDGDAVSVLLTDRPIVESRAPLGDTREGSRS